MNKFQKVKYICYLIVGVLCVVNMFPWFNIFTILLAIGGVLLSAYAIICLRKQKNILGDLPKPFRYICRFVVIAFIISFVAIESLVIVNGFKKDDIKPDYIIVLGAAIKEDKPSTALRYRLDEAYEQYMKHPSATIICSGGKAENDEYSEAEVMRNYLVDLGVPKDKLILEDNSYTTYQNLKKSYALVDDKDAKFLIVTNNFHSFRAKLIADKLGMNAYSSPSQKIFGGFTSSYIREYFSVIKTVVFD
ncbi:YdcF family protein [Breznakia pachnodae]|uniref:Uncharacterized SAM-binding protein YcdF (DUF218 family) n=1 Tax=Breznakia pachnodae TaxID=265178 RepID=A0ABU0E532_9FIRM|nr:YdcF family protein [Breznakia pachnodae]MDQ0362007.1 uncharacterized SAM-binding protein YcdF (DUF218 family) [Breznakia pachnodae]